MTLKPHVLFLFRDFSSVYRRNLVTLTHVARSQGFACAVIVEAGVSPPPEAHVDRVDECAAFGDPQALRSIAKRVAADVPVERVFALFEADVVTAGLVREDLAVAGPKSDVLIHFRNKTIMHARAAELGIPTPRSCLPLTWNVVREFVADVGFPVVLKPSGGHGAVNTSRVDSEAELARLWRGIGNEREMYRLEKYIEGTQYHVDCVVRDGDVVFEVLSRYTANLLNYKNEPGGTVTRQGGRTPREEAIFAVNRQVIRGFGLEVGITHGEYFLSDDGGIYLGEIGARPPGGSILPTIEAGTGVDLVRTWAAAEMDPTFAPPAARDGEASTRFLASREHGRVVRMTSKEELLRMDGVVEADLWRALGDSIGDPTRSSDFLGYLIARGASSEEAVQRVQRAADAFKVEIAA
jgi:biotin carboxylase